MSFVFKFRFFQKYHFYAYAFEKVLKTLAISVCSSYHYTPFDRKFYADFKFSCHKFRRPRILKKTSLGEVSLYQDNNPLKYSQYHSSSWYKDTSPMPEYRYGTTCTLALKTYP